MPESAEHLSLVDHIIRYIDQEFSGTAGLVVLADLPRSSIQEKPPRVGGYAPDVYAIDVPCTLAIIGEAKTSDDLDCLHSRNQIRAFLEFLRFKKQGILILAVPWQCVASARSMVKDIKRTLPIEIERISIVVLDGIPQ